MLVDFRESRDRAEKARHRETVTAVPSTKATHEIMGRLRSRVAEQVANLQKDFADANGRLMAGAAILDALSAEEVAEAILFSLVHHTGRHGTRSKFVGVSLQTFLSALQANLLFKARVAYLKLMENAEDEDVAKSAVRGGRAVAARSHFKFKTAALARVWKDIPFADKFDYAALMLHLAEIARRCDLAVIEDVGTSRVIRLTDRFQRALLALREMEDYLYPIFRPLTSPPAPWTSPTTGPYTGTAASYLPLIKSSIRLDDEITVGLDPAVQKAFEAGKLDLVMQAANAMQNTAWRVCRPIYDMVTWAREEARSVGKLRFGQRQEIGRLPDEDWKQMADDEKKAWKRERATANLHNRQVLNDGVNTTMILGMARQVLDAPFWLPVQIDYRGRLYYLPLLNPQASDWVRGMLEFAEAEPIGVEGMGWLMVHLANEGDFDKCSKRPFEDRTAWVVANEDKILRAAREPKEFLWWTKADHPFAFLAACMSYANVKDNGFDTPIHTPVAFDGSNSGVQHYSAALRDPVGGKSVNLIPSDKVEDIYEDVADLVRGDLATDTSAPAGYWSTRGVKRKDVKRQVMTYCYSSTLFRWQKNILKESLEVTNRPPTKEEAATAMWLAKRTMDAVRRQLRAAHEGMSWLQKVSVAYAKAGKPMIWESPVGLPVVLKRTVPLTKRIDIERKTEFKRFGQLPRMQLKVLKEGTKIDARAMQQSVGANFIHSLDASHAVLVIIHGARDYDIRNFQMIHDSFGTTPAKAAALFRAIRESFVAMYQSHDPFVELYETACRELGPDMVPPPPPKGALKIEDVIESRYCFA